MPLNFNDAGPQHTFEVIPENVIVTLQLKVRPGDAGLDAWLKRSKDGNAEMLDCEFTVVDGQYAHRKFWTNLTIAGTTPGHVRAGEISRGCIRAMLELARGIRPDDESEAAQKARQIESYADLDGLVFIGRVGVEPPRTGYKAKNTLAEVITPDRKDWKAPPKSPEPAAQLVATGPAKELIKKPTWAQ